MEYKVLKEEADEKWQEKVTGKWSLDGEIDRCYVWKWVIESRNSKPWELLEKIYEFMKEKEACYDIKWSGLCVIS